MPWGSKGCWLIARQLKVQRDVHRPIRITGEFLKDHHDDDVDDDDVDDDDVDDADDDDVHQQIRITKHMLLLLFHVIDCTGGRLQWMLF